MNDETKVKRWDAIIKRVPTDRAIIGVEIGVYQGKMSSALLEALPLLTLYMVDRWTPYSDVQRAGDPAGEMVSLGVEYFEAAYADAIGVEDKYDGRAIIIRADSCDAVAHVPDNLDFVFIDADHSYEGCKRDIIAWKPKVKIGGWLMGHDYPYRGVGRAVDELFTAGVETDKRRVWAIRCIS